jgi:hypothetical protein
MSAPDEALHGASNGVDVTPSDTGKITPTPRGLFIGTGGNITVEWLGGNVTTLENVADGTERAWQIVRVLSTGTTATGIVALY